MMSHSVRCRLIDYLEDLEDNELKKFKTHLEDYPLREGYKAIRHSKTENADRMEIARFMTEAYEDLGALKITVSILDRINKKDLSARIRKEMPDYFIPKLLAMTKKERREREEKIESNLHDKFFGTPKKVEITLDPKTAFPALILSEDRKSVSLGSQATLPPDHSERFTSLPCVLGAEGIHSGTLKWVVEVGQAKEWAIGIARESVERKRLCDITVAQGFWVLHLVAGEYKCSTIPPTSLTLWESPQRILVTLEHDFETLSFHNADSMKHIYTFNYPFSGKMFPFFQVGDKEIPLKICPGNS